MKIRLGVDIACRAPHQASCADEHRAMLFVGHRFRTDPDELDKLWALLPDNLDEVMVIMEPTRNTWVALLAAWFRRRGATVVMVPSEQSADLRAYYNKHAKTDRLDSKVLARPLDPDGSLRAGCQQLRLRREQSRELCGSVGAVFRAGLC